MALHCIFVSFPESFLYSFVVNCSHLEFIRMHSRGGKKLTMYLPFCDLPPLFKYLQLISD